MIYADYNSTAPLLPSVKEYLKTRLDTPFFANPNSLHTRGRQVKEILENSRRYCAKFLDADSYQIFYTSGATESLNWAIHSLLSASKNKIVISSNQEHPAVSKLLNILYLTGDIDLHLIPTLPSGEIDSIQTLDLINNLGNKIAFVTCLMASNETGVIHSLDKIIDLCNTKDIPILSDSTQLIGKVPFSFKSSKLSMAVVSGHKLGALPGCGILLVKNPKLLSPLIVGGEQEQGVRAGTENYLGIESLSIALNEIPTHINLYKDVQKLKNIFEQQLQSIFSNLIILGEQATRLPNTSYISFPQIHSQALQIELESENIFVTTSSACADNEPHTSISVSAMGLDDQIGRGAIRLSFGPNTSQQDFDYIVEKLEYAVNRLQRLKSR